MALPSSSRQPALSQGMLGVGVGKSTAYLLGAQFLRNLGPLLVLFFLARLTNPETVGVYSLALAIVTPFFVFAQLGLRTVTLTLRPEGAFRDYVFVQSGAVVLALIAAMVFCMIGTPELALVVLAAAFMKVADAFSECLSGPLQRHGRSVTVFTASLIAAIVVSIVAALVIYLTRELVPTLFGLAAASMLAAYLFLFRPAQKVSRAVESAQTPRAVGTMVEIRRIAAAGLPLGIAMSVMSLVSTVPQYVVTSSYGPAETARLAVLLYVYALADIVTGVISQAWIPHAQAHMHRIPGRHPVLALSVRGSLTWTLIYIPVTVVGLFGRVAHSRGLRQRVYPLARRSHSSWPCHRAASQCPLHGHRRGDPERLHPRPDTGHRRHAAVRGRVRGADTAVGHRRRILGASGRSGSEDCHRHDEPPRARSRSTGASTRVTAVASSSPPTASTRGWTKLSSGARRSRGVTSSSWSSRTASKNRASAPGEPIRASACCMCPRRLVRRRP